MFENEKQFVEDCISTLSSKKLHTTIVFTCALFAGCGIGFPFFLMSVSNYDISMVPVIETMILIGNVIGGIVCICIGIMLYIAFYNFQSVLQYMKLLTFLLISSVPGLITFLLMISATNSKVDLPFAETNICLFILCLGIGYVSFLGIHMKLSKDKEIHQKATFETILIGFVIVMICLLSFKLLPLNNVETIGNLALLVIIVSFYAYFIGRFLLAKKYINRFHDEFVEFENISYNASIHEGSNVLQRSLWIINAGQLELSLDILQEFGLSRKTSQRAILANTSIYTFVEGMRLNFRYLDYLVSRLSYEGISFEVKEWIQGAWVPCDETFYETIVPRKITRVRKGQEKDKEDTKFGVFGTFFALIFVIGFIIIYGIWILLFPINLFRPIAWMNEKTMKEVYRSFTYFDGRTFLHCLFTLVCIVTFLCIPQIQLRYVELLEMDSVKSLYVIFLLFFIVELLLFPLYLRRMERAIDKQKDRIHNYSKKAFIFFILMSILRSIRRGWELAFMQLSVLICAIESAKFVIILYRYIKNRHSVSPSENEDESYQFIDISAE